MLKSSTFNPSKEQKPISYSNSKYVNLNKYPQIKLKANNRYISNTNNPKNGYNNNLLYKSEIKSGYNQMVFPSFSPNNDLLLIKNVQQKNSYQNYKVVPKKNGGIISSQNSLNWNNIGYKEVKCKNNFGTLTYNLKNNSDNNNLLKSYNVNNNYGTNAKNLGFHNTYNINNNANNIINGNIYNMNNEKNNLASNNNYQNKLTTNKSTNLYSRKTFTKNILDNINNNINKSTNLLNSYASSTNNNDINNINKSTNLNSLLSSASNKKYQKQRIVNINPNNTNNSLYDYYKNLVQIQNARSGVKSRIIKNRINDEDNIKSITKIQAVWKGAYVRDLMKYYWSFNKFQNVIKNIMEKNYKKNFFKKLRNYEKNLDLEEKEDEKEENGINKEINVYNYNFMNKKQNELINDYNNILKKFNQYKKNNEKNKNKKYELIIDKNDNFVIIDNNNKENKTDNVKLRSVNKNNKKAIISYDDYLKHFNNNIQIINNEKINLEKIKPEKPDYIYDIDNNNYFTLKTDISSIIKPELDKIKSVFKNNEIKKENCFGIKKIEKTKKFETNNICVDSNNIYFDIYCNKLKDENINNNDNKNVINSNNNDSEEFDNYENFQNNNKITNKIQDIKIFTNDRFNIIPTQLEKNKEDIILLPSFIINLFIKGNNKENIDNSIETSNLLNLLKPIKNTELNYEGIIKEEKKENREILLEPNENIHINYEGLLPEEKIVEKINLINLLKPNKIDELNYQGIISEEKIEKINNNYNIDNVNNLILEKNKTQELDNKINSIIKNYNLVNEIEKGEALEINPYEIKRTKKDIIITYENDIEVLVNKNTLFNPKAKKNMMKIILPIRLKSVLLKSIQKQNFYKLLDNIKKIKEENIINTKDNYDNNKLKNIIEKEIAKYEIRKITKKYVNNLWKKGLLDLAKLIINNNINK